MDILITGAAGYIGSAVAEAVSAAGHTIHALAHSQQVAAEIRTRGWTLALGDLRDPASLARLATRVDAVVHAANTNGADAAEVDTRATRAMLRALEGTGKPLVYTSGAWVLGSTPGHVADERSRPNPIALVAWRAGLEAEMAAAAQRGVRAVVMRPGVVYGRGGGIPGKVERGELPVVGDGRQRWPLVHLDDLAQLYLLALSAPAGAILHGVAGTATMREIALLGKSSGRGPATMNTLPLEVARERFGDFADALALDQCISAEATRALLGWRPRAPSLIEELLPGSYARAA